MINYIEHNKGIEKLSQLLLEERLIPIFGAGFSKSSPSLSVDGNFRWQYKDFVACL